MKLLAILVLFSSPLLGHATLLGTEQTWDFMQSVGGISLGTPEKKGNRWFLPLLCDVSGLKEFTVKPTLLNFALVWNDTEAEVADQEILVTIETGVVNLSGKSTACGAAELGYVKLGKYRVIYRDPDGSKHLVGEVEIGL
jgi:hypothetical protein